MSFIDYFITSGKRVFSMIFVLVFSMVWTIGGLSNDSPLIALSVWVIPILFVILSYRSFKRKDL